jgi:thermitase
VRVIGHIPQLGVMLLQVPAGSEHSVAAELERQPGVQYVEPNYRAYALEVPNDEQYPLQWALPKIHAPQAWDIAHVLGGPHVVIAILDTGAYLQHPDLSNVLWTNPGEIADNGRDDDFNGKVDDIHGWHFYHDCTTGTCQPYENRIIDDGNGHGTHATGIAAAETNNAVGIAGVSWGARAMIVKVLDEYGDGYYYDIAAGIVYAADNGAKVINLSLGGESPSQVLQDAVNYAYGKGALVVAAAGNNGGAVFYPAACDNAIAVAATDANDQRASFSNQGPEVDIAAPGESILSTWPLPYLYYYKRGTSMAAPHVSGAAALLWSWRPDWSNALVQERLQTQADDVNSDLYPGVDPYLGWGRLNLYRVLAGLPQGPTPTVSPTATATQTATTTPTPIVSPTATATPTPTAVPSPVYRLYLPLWSGWPTLHP